MNDKFGYEVKQLEPKLKNSENWEQEIAKYTDKQYEMLLLRMNPDSAKLKRVHYLSNLHTNKTKKNLPNTLTTLCVTLPFLTTIFFLFKPVQVQKLLCLTN